MGDEHDRLVEVALESNGFLLQFGPHDGVDRAEWLIHQQDVGVGRKPARDADTLLLATRELAGIPVRDGPVEADRVEKLESIGSSLLPGHAIQHGNRRDIVDDLEMWQEAGVLHHVPNAAPKCDGVTIGDALTIDLDVTTRRINHPVDHPQQGGFAATGRTDKHRRLARGYDEAEIVDSHRAVGEALGDATKFDHYCGSFLVRKHGSTLASYSS